MKKTESTYLQRVRNVTELRSLSLRELPLYCAELREFIIESVAENPGHLGSSLGAVELAVALHYVYDTPEDRLIWDVGHQAYAHKIITGRGAEFHTNRKLGGISGFPKRSESEFDCYGGGHASVSISAAVGMAQANKIKGQERKIVAVIGDGALTGGLAFEGLINAGEGDMLVILNDNNISIDKGVGRLNSYLTSLVTSPGYNNLKQGLWWVFGVWPWMRKQLKKIGNGAKSFFLKRSNLFESLGFRYFGPIDGNDVGQLVRRLRAIRKIGGAKLLHIITVKGKGYAPAENDQTNWHAPGKFNPTTAIKEPTQTSGLRYQDVFGYTICELAKGNKNIVGITPAMPSGSGLSAMMQEFPDRCFDVGIAEGHAVTFAAGLACEGMLPYCAIYSSFAQRALDNIIHDITLQKLDVVLCLDRAGLVGEDGATHHGLYDIAMLRPLPNTVIAAPSSGEQLRNILHTTALEKGYGCFAIRYPRGGNFPQKTIETPITPQKIGKSQTIQNIENSSIAILSLGATLQIAKNAAQKLNATLVDLIFAKPLDTQMLEDIAQTHTKIITLEDGILNGGVGSAIRDYYAQKNINIVVESIGIDDKIIEHGTITQLWEIAGLTTQNIINTAKK